jgi:hypothetical protein
MNLSGKRDTPAPTWRRQSAASPRSPIKPRAKHRSPADHSTVRDRDQRHQSFVASRRWRATWVSLTLVPWK